MKWTECPTCGQRADRVVNIDNTTVWHCARGHAWTTQDWKDWRQKCAEDAAESDLGVFIHTFRVGT